MKTMKIRIRTLAEVDRDLVRAARRLDRGQRVLPENGVYFESLEAVRNVLTERRLAAWRVIRDRRPSSILELSRFLERDFSVVYADVRLLEAVGLVALRGEAGTRGRRQRPTSLADKLEVQVA